MENLSPRKPIEQMTPDELCKEAHRVREHIASAAELLGGIYSTLYTSVRRPPRSSSTNPLSNGETYAYVSVANAGKRLSGMVLQAVKRTSAMDKLVQSAKADAEEAEKDKLRKVAEEQRHQDKQRKEQDLEREFRARLFGYDPQTTQEDLIELYGDD